MPVAPQSINACGGISWLFMVNEQVMTKWLPCIDPFDTSILLNDSREIPEHFKPFKTKLFPSTKRPSCLG
jgi:hypothetical protein